MRRKPEETATPAYNERMERTAEQIAGLVDGARRGDVHATEKLVPLLYEELHRMAAALMARERHAATLQPTALVNEAYLRLVDDGTGDWQNRAHFLGAAAKAMRRVLVDHARARTRLKRGGPELERVTFSESEFQYETSPEELLALEEAMTALQAKDAEMARVVELRFFGGLSVAETAEVLGSSERTVHRQWTAARAWLHRALRPGAPSSLFP
jgi:RNA polymerase sigma factor (TIGR02999 family)